MYLYKRIIEDKNFLIKEENIKEFDNVLNKKVNQFYFNIIFALCEDNLIYYNYK